MIVDSAQLSAGCISNATNSEQRSRSSRREQNPAPPPASCCRPSITTAELVSTSAKSHPPSPSHASTSTLTSHLETPTTHPGRQTDTNTNLQNGHPSLPHHEAQPSIHQRLLRAPPPALHHRRQIPKLNNLHPVPAVPQLAHHPAFGTPGTLGILLLTAALAATTPRRIIWGHAKVHA